MKASDALNLHPLLKIAAMLIAGILAGHATFGSVNILWWIVAIIVFLILAICLRDKHLQSLSLLLSIFALGAYLVTNKESKLKIPLPQHSIDYEAVILTEPVERGKIISMDIGVLTPDNMIKVKAALLRDTITKRYTTLHVGDGIEAYSTLTAPANTYPSRFDYAEWLRMHDFAAQTFIYYKDWSKASIDLTRLSHLDRAILTLKRYRQKLVGRYERLGLSHQNLAIVAAMTLGDKHLISRQTKDDYSISGASHILALSGLHLGIIYAILAHLLTLLATVPFLGWIRKRGVAQLLLMTALWSYAFLAGFSPSIVRSVIMLTIYSVISLINLEKISLNTLSLAAIIMLVANPLTLYDVGFQLSFTAVAGILLLAPLFFAPFNKTQLSEIWFFRWIYGMLVISLCAQIFTAPLIAHHFGRISCYALLTNLIVVPCAALILYLSFIFFFSSTLPTLQSFLADALTSLSQAINQSTSFISHLPGASIENIYPTTLQTAIIYLLLLSVYLLISILARRIKFHDRIRSDIF